MKNWIQRMVSWFFQPKLLWRTIVGFLIVTLFLLIFPITEPLVRYSGLGLQVAGLITVLYGIFQTMRLFGRPPLRERAAMWLGSFPKFRPEGQVVNLAAQVSGSVAVSGRVKVRHRVGLDASLEDRVRSLEANLDALDNHIEDLQNQIDEATRERDERVSAERQARQRDVEDVRTQLEQSETSGLDVSFMGLIWLIVGLILTTASLELSRLL